MHSFGFLFVLVLGFADICDEELCAPEALQGYAHLLARTAFSGEREYAAFLVREDDGKLRLVEWHSYEDLHAFYKGVIPANSIAVVHTHPAGDRYPSPHDVAEAQRIRLPIIVVSQYAVTIVRTDGCVEVLEHGGAWRSAAK